MGHEEDLKIMRGRLHVVRQVTTLAARPDMLACRFDELSENTPLNRVLKAAVVRLANVTRSAANARLLAELAYLQGNRAPRRSTGPNHGRRRTTTCADVTLLSYPPQARERPRPVEDALVRGDQLMAVKGRGDDQAVGGVTVEVL